jgi:hypothetical protein
MKPTASPPYFPYPHRTLAEVWADEARCRKCGQTRAAPCAYTGCPLAGRRAA